MIAKEQIRILASKYQTTELNVRREYFQHLFLSYFYQQQGTERIYFKGGTALRILYGSPRFSEDLDFTSSIHDPKEIEQILESSLSQIEKEGITISLEESKPTSGGYLTKIKFSALEEIVLIQIQISFRLTREKGEVLALASDFIPAYTVNSLVLEQLVDEKMQALFARKKPRDFYDLYFILRANLLPLKKKGILLKALAILKQTEINFENELKQFLPKSHWAIMRDFKVVLTREIQRFI